MFLVYMFMVVFEGLFLALLFFNCFHFNVLCFFTDGSDDETFGIDSNRLPHVWYLGMAATTPFVVCFEG